MQCCSETRLKRNPKELPLLTFFIVFIFLVRVRLCQLSTLIKRTEERRITGLELLHRSIASYRTALYSSHLDTRELQVYNPLLYIMQIKACGPQGFRPQVCCIPCAKSFIGMDIPSTCKSLSLSRANNLRVTKVKERSQRSWGKMRVF